MELLIWILKSSYPPPSGTLFFHNWYYGPWLNRLPYDPEKMKGDPMFVAHGTGSLGLETFTGYKLRTLDFKYLG